MYGAVIFYTFAYFTEVGHIFRKRSDKLIRREEYA